MADNKKLYSEDDLLMALDADVNEFNSYKLHKLILDSITDAKAALDSAQLISDEESLIKLFIAKPKLTQKRRY